MNLNTKMGHWPRLCICKLNRGEAQQCLTWIRALFEVDISHSIDFPELLVHPLTGAIFINPDLPLFGGQGRYMYSNIIRRLRVPDLADVTAGVLLPSLIGIQVLDEHPQEDDVVIAWEFKLIATCV